MSFNHRMIHGYSEITITLSEYSTVLKQYGYAGRESVKHSHSLLEKTENNQGVPVMVERGRESTQVSYQSTFNSPEEMEFYFETLGRLQKEGKSRKEAVRLAHEALEEWTKLDDAPF